MNAILDILYALTLVAIMAVFTVAIWRAQQRMEAGEDSERRRIVRLVAGQLWQRKNVLLYIESCSPDKLRLRSVDPPCVVTWTEHPVDFRSRGAKLARDV